MQAITQHSFGGPEVLVLEEVPRPEPIPSEVLLRVRAVGVNHKKRGSLVASATTPKLHECDFMMASLREGGRGGGSPPRSS